MFSYIFYGLELKKVLKMQLFNNNNLCVIFPIKKDKASLGGLLTLKQEIDLFCSYNKIKKVEIFCDFHLSGQYLKLLQNILGDSVNICKTIPKDTSFLWPKKFSRSYRILKHISSIRNNK